MSTSLPRSQAMRLAVESETDPRTVIKVYRALADGLPLKNHRSWARVREVLKKHGYVLSDGRVTA